MSPTPPPPADDARRPALLLVLSSASFLISLLFNLVIPLIVVLPAALDVSAASATWVATGFFLVGAVANPVGGRLADLYGRRRILVVCLWLLVAGSVVSALAPTLPVLLAGRALQALSMPMMSVSLSILRQELPLRHLPSAVGWTAAAMGVGNGLGLVAGGYLIDTFSWHAVFWATAVVALPVALLAPFVVPASPGGTRQSLDLPGVLGLVVILVGVLLPLSKIADWGLPWTSVLMLAVSLAWSPWWVRGRARRPDPVVDVRTFRNGAIAATHLVAMAAGFAGFTGFVVTSHVLQSTARHGFDMSLTAAGLCLTPASMSFLVVGPLTSKMIVRFSMRNTLVLGGVVTATGAAAMAAGSSVLAVLLIASFLVLVGNGILMSALPVATGAYAPSRDIASVNGVNALARTTGIAVASALFALVVGLAGTEHLRQVAVWCELPAVAAGLGVVALAVLVIPRRA